MGVLISECPYFRGVLISGCPYFSGVLISGVSLFQGCPYFRGVLISGSNVHSSNVTWNLLLKPWDRKGVPNIMRGVLISNRQKRR